MNKNNFLIITISLISSILVETILTNYLNILLIDLFISIILILLSNFLKNKNFKLSNKNFKNMLLFYLINLTSININFLIFNTPFIITKFITIVIITIYQIKKVNINKHIPYLILLNLSIIFGLNSSMSPIGNKNSSMDSSVFRYIGLLISKGKIPYIDVFDHKGILLYFINYLAIIINKNLGLWLIEVLTIFLSSCFAYKTANLFAKKYLSLLTIIFCFITLIFAYDGGGNYTEEYALFFIMLSLYYFYRDVKKDSLIRISSTIIIGISLGAVLLLRPNMITVWICMSFYILINYVKNKKIKELLKIILIFISSCILFMLPFIIYLIYNNAIIEFINQYVIFNFKYSALHKTTNIYITSTYFIMGCKNIIISILVIFYFLFTNKENKNLLIFSLFNIIISLILVIIPNNLYNHYAIILIPTFIYPITLLFKQLDKILLEKNFNKKEIITVILIFIISMNINEFNKYIGYFKRSTLQNYPDKYIEEIILNNSTSKDNVLIYGNKAILYLKTNRYTKLKYPYQEPITNIDNELLNEFKKEFYKNKPQLIVVPIEYFDHFITKISNVRDYYNKIPTDSNKYMVYKLK